ncbi:MAG: phytoene desaturase family protein [Myxococcota bacterium]|jgi:1-hydroxycarotenoid 3,4-desaturase|nr:phytoene desaturase family protein [Myxococcota bacterium]
MSEAHLGHRKRVVVVGAGIGGLVAAAELAAKGARVELLERASTTGGKIQEVELCGRRIDVGPTVLTMRWVFDQVFADLGERFDERVTIEMSKMLGRHFFEDGSVLDLHFDAKRSQESIRAFAGFEEARGYADFVDYSAGVYDRAASLFIGASVPSLMGMARAARQKGFGAVWGVDPFRKMHRVLASFFADDRLRRLFGRYATYYGSSPFMAPATLNLIAHVESQGVWLVKGGMKQLARAMEQVARERGVEIRCGTHVEHLEATGGGIRAVHTADGNRIACDAVVFNGDVSALRAGALGETAKKAVPRASHRQRSLSALTVAALAETGGFPLAEHNVFFPSSPYFEEFKDIYKRSRLPRAPVVYVRAQDRDGSGVGARGAERLFLIINAPSASSGMDLPNDEVQTCLTRARALLEHCGLKLDTTAAELVMTTPSQFASRFPYTDGALYGRATHSPLAALRRSGARTRLPGLYVAGGSVHPGAGVPMSALSGRAAAAALLEDLGLATLCPPGAIDGGISMDSAKIAASE